MQNSKKMDFIICYNDKLYLKECMDYISFLKVPADMEIGIISVVEADSMAAGYNEAMRASNALYKVYLHQDVFIINENFICDVMDVFMQYPEYGMLGVLGSDRMVGDANYCGKWNVGTTQSCNSIYAAQIVLDTPDIIREVVAIDGMIMITQHDISWREDIFDGFDFYDISQCAEFNKAGYKVGVPKQNSVWCMHDCGHTKLTKYNHYREIFCREYKNLGYEYADKDYAVRYNMLNLEVEKILPLIEKNISEGDIIGAKGIVEEVFQMYKSNTRLCELRVLCNIILLQNSSEKEKIFYNMSNVNELLERLRIMKFALRRVEYGKPRGDYTEIIGMFEKKEYMSEILKILVDSFLVEPVFN
ncbi:MAG: hypothetical protein E7261_03265 [Lachnospiraceae bacterium]|nr:hypothetical protein [Lachnospiraceae bacterium]